MNKLKIGSTATGGSSGMAALEGYAAAIEVRIFHSSRTHTVVLRNVRCLTTLRVASIRSLCAP